MYSGQAASAFTQGMQSGYNFVDQAKSRLQNRQIQAEQFKQQSALWQEQYKRNMLKTAAQEQIWKNEVGQPLPYEQQVQIVKQENQQLKKQVMKNSGKEVTQDINGFIVSKDKSAYLETIKTKAKKDPTYAKAIGIEDPEKVRMPNYQDQADRNKLIAYYQRLHPNASVEQINKMFAEDQKNGNIVMYGDKIVRVTDLAKATGAPTIAVPEVKKKVEETITTADKVALPEVTEEGEVPTGEGKQQAGPNDNVPAQETTTRPAQPGNQAAVEAEMPTGDESMMTPAPSGEIDAPSLETKVVEEGSNAVDRNVADMPYQSGRQQAALYKIAGYGDPRSSLGRDLDYVYNMLGPDSTVGEVLDAYKFIQEAKKITGNRPFQYQQLIQDYNAMVDQKVANGEISKEEGEKRKSRFTENVMTRFGGGGASQVRTQENIDAGNQNRQTFNYAMNELSKNGKVDSGTKRSLYNNEMKIAQANKTEYNRVVKDVDNSVTVYKQSQRVLDRVEQNMDKYKRGDVNTVVAAVSRYSPWLAKQLGMTDEEFKATISTNTAAGMLLADYMKSISGTAISQAEMARLASILQGGNAFSSPEAMKEALTQFTQELKYKAEGQIKDAADKGFGYTALNAVEEINSPSKVKQEQQAKQTQQTQQTQRKPEVLRTYRQGDWMYRQIRQPDGTILIQRKKVK